MRHAIIADVHANAAALRAALGDAHEQDVSAVACLGDLVGYHAQPHETLAIVRDRRIPTVAGNHDRMAVSGEPPNGGPLARAAMHWTRRVLRDDELIYLADLPIERYLGADALLVHSVPWSTDFRLTADCDYVEGAARLGATHPGTRICFTGHTHIAGTAHVSTEGIVTRAAETEVTLELDDGIWFVNPGSVGLPRDGSTGAPYAIYDDEARTLAFRCAQYDMEEINLVNRTCGLHTRLPEPVRAHGGTPVAGPSVRRWLAGWI